MEKLFCKFATKRFIVKKVLKCFLEFTILLLFVFFIVIDFAAFIYINVKTAVYTVFFYIYNIIALREAENMGLKHTSQLRQ